MILKRQYKFIFIRSVFFLSSLLINICQYPPLFYSLICELFEKCDWLSIKLGPIYKTFVTVRTKNYVWIVALHNEVSHDSFLILDRLRIFEYLFKPHG